MKQSSTIRLTSIDILRALTMFFMVFVNDLWTLSGVPKWLQHAKASEDYLGFSDVIFPLFLFIVGLSIPLAIQNRQNKGDSRGKIAWHILIRSASLLIMGFFMVNKEYSHSESMLISSNWWMLIMAFGLSFIWIDWKRSTASKTTAWIFQGVGIALLIFLMIIYKGGAEGDRWMRTYWWGILGLIGWAYLINSLIYLFSNGKLAIMAVVLLLFTFFSVAHQLDWMSNFGFARIILNPLFEGTLAGFTAAGMLATVVFQKFNERNRINWFYLSMVALVLLTLVFGFLLKPEWGISKLRSTPSWLGICSAIGFALFALFYWIADQKGKKNWYTIIKPAGTATLTCYLLPYFIYPLREILGITLPDFFTNGWIGIMKSLLFALVVVMLTGLFEKLRIKLKL